MIFFFNDTATTEIYTLSLHDALPILGLDNLGEVDPRKDVTVGRNKRSFVQVLLGVLYTARGPQGTLLQDRKSTRLNSSHANISYAVFCLKKKKKIQFIHQSVFMTETS